MPFQSKAVLKENRPLGGGVHLLALEASEIAGAAGPGQFVHLRSSGGEDFWDPLLRRPISIHDVDVAAGRVLLLVRRAGRGTRWLNGLAPGSTVDLLGPLGRGFDLVVASPGRDSRSGMPGGVFVAGGGIGVAPLVFLARSLVAAKTGVEAFVGARDAGTLLGLEAFSALGVPVHIATDDGSLGFHGNVVELMERTLAARMEVPDRGLESAAGRGPARIYACGPKPMLRRIRESALLGDIPCQVSLEERMGCGIGACLGCTCQGKGGPLRVCADGPVFWAEELSW